MGQQSGDMGKSAAASRWITEAATDIYTDRHYGGGDFDKDGPGTTDDVAREVVVKNKLLGLIGDLESNRILNPRFLLWSLEMHAQSTEEPEDTRHHQLAGLLHIVGAVVRDPDLSELFVQSTFGKEPPRFS
jgi:hypothetical protein